MRRSGIQFNVWALAWLACALAWGTPEVAHIIEPFELQGRELDRHVIFPVFTFEQSSLTGPYYLAALAGFIRDDADRRGWTQGVSGQFYTRELAQYRAGKWPCAFITKRGQWAPLMHLAYANRWEEAPLPWEARFLGDDDGVLPKSMEQDGTEFGDNFVFEHSNRFPELNSGRNRARLEQIAPYIPEIAGERTELKFLMGAEPSLLLFRELLAASQKYGLHRFSFRHPSARQRGMWELELERFDLKARLVEWLREPFESDRPEEIRAYLQANLLSPSFRPFVRNSWVYAQVSGEPLGENRETTRRVLLGESLQLPPPAFSFLESPSVGTAGIRTDIDAVHMARFEQGVLLSLESHPKLKGKVARYSGVSYTDEHVNCGVRVMVGADL